MNKVELGRKRKESFFSVIKSFEGLTHEQIRGHIAGGIIKKNGEFSKSALANMVGYGTEPATFRQNKDMKASIIMTELLIKEVLGNAAPGKRKDNTTIGKERDSKFLDWIETVGTETPAPVNHAGRLYKKGLWAIYSGQDIADDIKIPTFFYRSDDVKDAIDSLDLSIVNNQVSNTIDMSSESIADDMGDSMTSAAIRKLKQENKALKEKVELLQRQAKAWEAEANAASSKTKSLQQEVNKFESLERLMPSGKLPH